MTRKRRCNKRDHPFPFCPFPLTCDLGCSILCYIPWYKGVYPLSARGYIACGIYSTCYALRVLNTYSRMVFIHRVRKRRPENHDLLGPFRAVFCANESDGNSLRTLAGELSAASWRPIRSARRGMASRLHCYALRQLLLLDVQRQRGATRAAAVRIAHWSVALEERRAIASRPKKMMRGFFFIFLAKFDTVFIYIYIYVYGY